MDHWGDPWADNANDKSPTKSAVTSPLPPAFTFAPVPLHGFEDDAGWGNNEEDDFEDWATSPRAGEGGVALTDTEPPPAERQVEDADAHWDATSNEAKDTFVEEWPDSISSTLHDIHRVDSEPSDSATVSQSDEVTGKDTAEVIIPQAQPDIESVRSSTSPSETSRNEVPTETPRTSIEDERTKDKIPQDEAPAPTIEAGPVLADDSSGVQQDEGDKDSDTSEIADELETGKDDTEQSSSCSSEDSSKSESGGEHSASSDGASTTVAPSSSAQSTTYICDDVALAHLFPANKTSDEPTSKEFEVHDDPIYSTSARKAWYRLTRKQTMREFNHGDDDDNYVRVAWSSSHIRAEVNKVVGRWAREDRISGTGPGARASFYWDTPAHTGPEASWSHSRTQSSVPNTKTSLPARQSLPPLSTDKAAAFDWSSPGSADPWKLDSPVSGPAFTPLTLKNPAVTKIQRQEGRAVSVDLTSRKPESLTHKRTATVSHAVPETPAVTGLIYPPISKPIAEISAPGTNTSSISSSSSISTSELTAPAFDDDDWGEMVQTPTLPTPHQLDPFSYEDKQASSLAETTSPERPPAQDEAAELMSASPIVRLQSAISPTSALFRANSFVPLHVEQGPIGPGMLKPAGRNLRPISSNSHQNEEKIATNIALLPTDDNENASNSAHHISTASGSMSTDPAIEQPVAVEPIGTTLTPIDQPAISTQAADDSWADADFSFFESAPPVTIPQSMSQIHDPSDPLSFFDTPSQAPSKSSRSPPRDYPPPPLQPPLTSATSSAQRRKDEEDQIINEIIRGLPDLSFMLR